MRTALFLVIAACAFGATGCPSPAQEGKYPPRPEGCDVQMFQGAPGVMNENIGPVTATCGADIKDDDCMRTLKDQACKLGANILWGVSDTPSNGTGKKQLAGRAAHTKTAGK